MKVLFVLLAALRVAFVGDPQVDSERELEYARKSIYSELRNRNDLDLIIVLGDLVNEKPGLVQASEQLLDQTGKPWFRVHGNHDGSNPVRDTAVTMRHTCFILMNNIRRSRKGGYDGGLSESQKAWLRGQLDKIPAKDRIVICTHIPVSQSRGADSLANILSGRENVLYVSGHTHNVDRRIMERGKEELIVGASCGTWWRGVKDKDGIPYALMNCGAPRGYFVADFKTCTFLSRPGYWYRLAYKAIGRQEGSSAHVLDGTLYVNVFGGSRDGKVSVGVGPASKLEGGLLSAKWPRLLKLIHRYCTAPETRAVIEANSRLSKEYRREHRDEFMPLRDMPSPHVWAIDLDARTLERLKQAGEVTLHYQDRNMRLDEKLLISF